MYSLMKWSDRLAPGATAVTSTPAQHSIIFVAQGSAHVNGVEVDHDSAVYAQDSLAVSAGGEGAELWRWGLGRVGDGFGLLEGQGISSVLRMTRRIKMFELVPTSKWLFRLDSIVECSGCTGLHSHPGSGIRCLVDGRLTTVSDKGENATADERGDVWYEEGAYPLVTTFADGKRATFLRGMVLPPEFAQYGDTATFIEPVIKGEVRGYTNFCQQIVTLR